MQFVPPFCAPKNFGFWKQALERVLSDFRLHSRHTFARGGRFDHEDRLDGAFIADDRQRIIDGMLCAASSNPAAHEGALQPKLVGALVEVAALARETLGSALGLGV